MTTLREELFDNGLRLVFTDESNRYFGDYHRVCVVATISCNLHGLGSKGSVDELFWSRVRDRFGEQLSVSRRFERMGVATARVEETRSGLIDDFMRHTAPYLSRDSYVRSLAEAELSKTRPRRSYAP